MKKEEELKRLDDELSKELVKKVMSYLKATLVEEELDESLEEKVLSYVVSYVTNTLDDEQISESLDDDGAQYAAYAIAEYFIDGFWYAFELLDSNMSDEEL